MKKNQIINKEKCYLISKSQCDLHDWVDTDKIKLQHPASLFWFTRDYIIYIYIYIYIHTADIAELQ